MEHLHMPTACLPAISKLHGHHIVELQAWVNYLRVIYNPEVRGSRRRTAKLRSTAILPHNLPVGIDLAHVDFNSMRNDSFERSYAIRWLTALVSRADSLVDSPQVLSVNTAGIEAGKITVDQLVDNAASLLAICAGASATGTLIRLFTFGPSLLGEQVSIHLTDAPLESQDFSSVGAQTWGGACVMADMIITTPDEFGIPPDAVFDRSASSTLPHNIRILELGAGTGLVGLTVGKLLQSRNLKAEIVLSDFHSSVLRNLKVNIEANFPRSELPKFSVQDCCLDWELFSRDVKSRSEPILNIPFDIVLGTDIIYEPSHALWIRDCLKDLLRRPDLSPVDGPSTVVLPPAHFHLVIPLRHTHQLESNTIEQVFPLAATEGLKPTGVEAGLSLHLAILHTERFLCDAGIDNSYCNSNSQEDVEYAYYRIGWHFGNKD